MKKYHVAIYWVSFACIGLALAAQSARADEVFSSNFANGSFDSLGWKSKASNWQITDITAGHPDIKNSPGPCAVYGKTDDTDLLIKTFPSVSKPSSLTLTFDAGWAWGSKDQGADSLSVFLLDDKGNGYDFEIHRIKATWAAQWGVVVNYAPPKKMNWSGAEIDATQSAVMDGGGLQTFTIKRDQQGTWQFSGANWTGAVPFQFVEPDVTTSSFSQVVLVGSKNFDGLLFNKVHLDIMP